MRFYDGLKRPGKLNCNRGTNYRRESHDRLNLIAPLLSDG